MSARAMDYTNLTRADCHYIDMLCADEGARDFGQGLDRALATFGERCDLDLAPGEIYTPTQAEYFEITRLTVNEINGGNNPCAC